MNEQTEEKLHFTLEKIEEVIGEPLCKTAHNNRTFWYPNKNRALGKIIYNADYDIEKIDLPNKFLLLNKVPTE